MEYHWKVDLRIAYGIASMSNDPSTKNGALLIDDKGNICSEGCNFFADGVCETLERWERPLKYEYVEHAERNVIYAAAKRGVKTNGLIMVCPWALCADCARAIIQSGIKLLVTHKQAYDRSPERWREQIDRALQMLKEAKVEVIMYDGKIGGVTNRHNGELWEP